MAEGNTAEVTRTLVVVVLYKTDRSVVESQVLLLRRLLLTLLVVVEAIEAKVRMFGIVRMHERTCLLYEASIALGRDVVLPVSKRSTSYHSLPATNQLTPKAARLGIRPSLPLLKPLQLTVPSGTSNS